MAVEVFWSTRIRSVSLTVKPCTSSMATPGALSTSPVDDELSITNATLPVETLYVSLPLPPTTKSTAPDATVTSVSLPAPP